MSLINFHLKGFRNNGPILFKMLYFKPKYEIQTYLSFHSKVDSNKSNMLRYQNLLQIICGKLGVSHKYEI